MSREQNEEEEPAMRRSGVRCSRRGKSNCRNCTANAFAVCEDQEEGQCAGAKKKKAAEGDAGEADRIDHAGPLR